MSLGTRRIAKEMGDNTKVQGHTEKECIPATDLQRRAALTVITTTAATKEKDGSTKFQRHTKKGPSLELRQITNSTRIRPGNQTTTPQL
ncbi:hypothetical protein ACOMHN_022805 [Nucella lapillus]